MAWRMTGTYYAPCSCKVGCPCELGETEGDRGWCSGSLAFAIDKGNVDGEDIGGSRVVLVGDWPSGFLGGNGTGRLYFDPSIAQKKRAALEKVFQGQMGGVWEPVATLMAKWMPSKEAAIQIKKDGDTTRVSVANFGELVTTPLKGQRARTPVCSTEPLRSATTSFSRKVPAHPGAILKCAPGKAAAIPSRLPSTGAPDRRPPRLAAADD